MSKELAEVIQQLEMKKKIISEVKFLARIKATDNVRRDIGNGKTKREEKRKENLKRKNVS